MRHAYTVRHLTRRVRRRRRNGSLSAVTTVGALAALSLGGLLAFDHLSGQNATSPGGAPAVAGQAAGYALGSAATAAAGGVYQGYSQTVQDALCRNAGGGGYNPATGQCDQPFQVAGGLITPDTPILGGIVGFLTS